MMQDRSLFWKVLIRLEKDQECILEAVRMLLCDSSLDLAVNPSLGLTVPWILSCAPAAGPDGLHHLVWEVVDNSVDEALAGHATFVTTTINADGSVTVVDDGRGIPTDKHPTTGQSALETVLTVLHAGGKFENSGGNSGYKVSGGLHGVGISVVNALSEFVEVCVLRKEKYHDMRFERGVPTGPLGVTPASSEVVDDPDVQEEIETLQAIKLSDDEEKADIQQQIDNLKMLQSLLLKRKTGTEVKFLPDKAVFKGENGKPDITFDATRLRGRMDEIAYLNAGLVLALQDKRAKAGKRMQVFYHAGGLAEYIDLLCKNKTPLFAESSGSTPKRNKASIESGPAADLLAADGKTILCSGTITPDGYPPVAIDVALRWSSDMYTETILSFCNNIRTRDGGSHVEGLKACLTRTINASAKRLGKAKEGAGNIPGEFIREGLTAVVSIAVSEAEFEGQTKVRCVSIMIFGSLKSVL